LEERVSAEGSLLKLLSDDDRWEYMGSVMDSESRSEFFDSMERAERLKEESAMLRTFISSERVAYLSTLEPRQRQITEANPNPNPNPNPRQRQITEATMLLSVTDEERNAYQDSLSHEQRVAMEAGLLLQKNEAERGSHRAHFKP